MKKIKIQFDPNQSHQLDPIQNTLNLFDGITPYEFRAGMETSEFQSNVGPYFAFDAQFLIENLISIQENHSKSSDYSSRIDESTKLHMESGGMVDGVSWDTWEYPSFTVDMETGTGKTYVYLRTIFALKEKYGFSKFIIIVPSIAIYEGVMNSWKSLVTHLKAIYNNEPANLTAFDGEKMNMIRSFAKSSNLEVLVMTIDSFNKKTNKLFKETEGFADKLPYQWIQELRPILILDESQNYRSDSAQKALRTLKPLFALNYSATPNRTNENRIYTLSPIDAFRMNLVKKIEVLGVYDLHRTYQSKDSLFLERIYHVGKSIQADVRLIVNSNGTYREESVKLKDKSNLLTLTKNEAYQGVKVLDINSKEGFIEFSNGQRLDLEQGSLSISKEEVFRIQIRETITKHFAKQEKLAPLGIKVISLFFIDKVDNYVNEDSPIRKIFEEEFSSLKKGKMRFKDQEASEVHKGYFAKRKAKKGDTEEFVDTREEEDRKNKQDKESEKEAYDLIMKDKERLLSFDEPVSFVFAHSALKEGWDNPNVFQICVLREISTERQRRQTIGRGMRLPVDQNGIRLIDRDLNILTVIANDSYANFAAQLQREYREAGDVREDIPMRNASETETMKRTRRFDDIDFQDFWNKLIRKTEYNLIIDSDEIIRKSSEKLNEATYPNPRVQITEGKFIITDYTISVVDVSDQSATLRLEKSSATGESSDQNISVSIGDDLGKKSKNEIYNGYKITSIHKTKLDSYIQIEKLGELRQDRPIQFSTERGQSVQTREVDIEATNLPKFNLIDRACKEVPLTRNTILSIFKSMKKEKKEKFLQNPEGFAGVFIQTIKEEVANHIAEKVEYELKNEREDYPMEVLFPPEDKKPVVELVPAKEDSSIYDLVQVDSDIERSFVNRLNIDEKVLLYFKFPTKYKIHLPKLIGNYNPDWAILRWDENNRIKLELVRETKGNIDPTMLRFSNEGRKIRCAEKHFSRVGVSYRHITDLTEDWWKSDYA